LRSQIPEGFEEQPVIKRGDQGGKANGLLTFIRKKK